ncbi:unnamed protein product, partial [Didymodactylos carnosus]
QYANDTVVTPNALPTAQAAENSAQTVAEGMSNEIIEKV